MLISCPELEEKFETISVLHIFDCRFDLKLSHWGIEEYTKSHIPHARFVDLDKDLSGPKNSKKGRHPLPSPIEWAKTRANLGITLDDEIVLYDQAESMFACRMWWMLRATGHRHIKILNGGFAAWKEFGGALETGINSVNAIASSQAVDATDYDDLITMEQVQENIAQQHFQILDARASERFKGDVEPLDPIAGHIPGAKNRPNSLNLQANKMFKDPTVLKDEFESFGISPLQTVHQCGSGVTACHNLFAMELAGLSGSKLYAGSWSEWCNHPENPIARGA
jgi:thiosulfate/3-mercaptopyruvate sulfurtransferase